MSSREKAGLGYSPVNDRYAEGMHDVPPPMTRIYIPSGPDKEIDDSQFTYGPKQSKPSESDATSSDFTSCESNTSEETHESMPETVVDEPNVVSLNLKFGLMLLSLRSMNQIVKMNMCLYPL
ncbi:hypothetical protein Tco_1223085, partial [Tanacetum coccineum]